MNQNKSISKPLNNIFLLTCIGQIVSLFGTHLTGFAVSVRLLEQTESTTLYALAMFAVATPEIVLAPFVGAIADRWNRRWVLICGHAGAGFCSLLLALHVATSALSPLIVILLAGLSSVFNATQATTFAAVTPMLVPQKNLGRANGLIQMGMSAVTLGVPALAGFLLLKVALWHIIAIDIATFLFAIGVLAVVRFPTLQTADTFAQKQRGSMWREISEGWRYIRQRPGLFRLLLFFALVSFQFGLIQPLLGPFVLSFADSAALGMVLSIGGAGMLIGGGIMAAWGGPKKKIYGILFCTALQGLTLIPLAWGHSVVSMAIAIFIAMAMAPLIRGCNMVIWQQRVPHELQGRVLSFQTLVGAGSVPLAFLAAGPLADYVFEPLMAPAGALAQSLGPYLGTGPGHGVALLFILLGITIISVTGIFLSLSKVRNLEDDLPEQPQPSAMGMMEHPQADLK